MNKSTGFGFYVILILMVFFFWYYFAAGQSPSLTQSEYENAMENGSVVSIAIRQNAEVPTGSAHIMMKNRRKAVSASRTGY